MMEYLETTEDLEKYHGGEYGVNVDLEALDGVVVIDDDVGDGGAAALEALLNQVVVGEESFRTPKKGKSNVLVSVEIEEPVELELDVPLPPPAVGMVFASMLEIDEYFRNYGQQQGFGVVRASGAKSGKGMKRNCRWTCECYGKTVRKRKKPEPRLVSDAQISEDEDLCPKRKSKKCDCTVFLYAKVNKSGQWVIDKAHLTHVGHNPTPGKSKNISRFRKKFLVDNPHLVRQLFIERKAGVPVANIYRSMAKQRNGLEDMPFEQKDLHAEVAKLKKLVFEQGDAKVMFDYFKRMLEDNDKFFHTYRVDDEGRLKDVLWVDARSRAAYEEFGDIVVFDSTYLTNEYKLPFCNFVGVNHHGQTILLGCALVSRETAETFEWVFSSWLRCMGDKAPIGILTDQDPAMRKALKAVMKGTTHRWCIWHILNKFSQKLGKRIYYPELKEGLHRAVYNSLDCQEFEQWWPEVIKKYKADDDEWLAGLFEERAMWVPAFVKHLFWAGMKTTQRVESIHSFFDGYLSKHTLLHEFVERYEEALSVRASTEKKTDDNNARYVRKACTDFPAELLFQQIYTDAKFKEVQRECTRMMYVSGIERRQVSEQVLEHVIEDRVWYKPQNSKKEIPSKRKRRYVVTFDIVTKDASCECKHFDCHGIICRHIIKVYELHDHLDIPEKFILKRWRKDVIRSYTRVKVGYHDPSKTEEVCRFDKMMVKFNCVCSKSSFCKETTKLVLDTLQLIEIQVNEMVDMINKKAENNGGCCENGTPVTPSTQRQGSCSEIPKDPPIPKKPPHRTTDVRFPSCIEKKKKGGRSNNTRKTSSQKNCVQQQFSTPPNSQGFYFPYSPQSVGGIQMVDGDGSIGYFTGVSGGPIGAGHVAGSESDRQAPYRPGFLPYFYTQYRPMNAGAVGAAIPNSPPTPRSSACSLAGGRPMFRPIAPKPPTPRSTHGCFQKAATQLQFSQNGSQQSPTQPSPSTFNPGTMQ